MAEKSNETRNTAVFLTERESSSQNLLLQEKLSSKFFFINTSLKDSEKWPFSDIADKWMLYHDNSPCHTALQVTVVLTSKGIPVVSQPSYSHDLCDFLLFHKLKNALKGRHFGTLENIQKSVTDMLKTIPVEDFQRSYQKWEQRRRRCSCPREQF